MGAAGYRVVDARRLQHWTRTGCLGSMSSGITVSTTGARSVKPSWFASARVRSITRLLMKGPRSLMRTVMMRPLFVLMTRTIVPNGNVRWAAVKALEFDCSPLAVCPPLL